VLRGILLNGGVGVIVLWLAGLVLTLLAPSQALAVVVVGVSLVAFGIGSSVELDLPRGWPTPLQLWRERRPRF
jgi:uncharacterized membrane protein HdeD (DUF308 family)